MALEQIDAVFQRYLGRKPTPQEAEGFESLYRNNAIDSVGLAQFIQSSPEYLRSQAPGIARDYLSTQGKLDQEIAAPLLQKGFDAADSRLRQNGRPYSSALASAYARVSGDVYGNMAQNRSRDVASLMNPYYGAAASGPAASQGYDIYNQGRQRLYGIQDREFGIQQNELMRADNMRQAKMNQWGALGGGLMQATGSALGGYFSQPKAVK